MQPKVTSKRDKRVLNYIRQFGGITTLEAIKELGNTRLSDSIFNLRRLGYVIEDEWQEYLNRYKEKCRIKRYSLGYGEDDRCKYCGCPCFDYACDDCMRTFENE